MTPDLPPAATPPTPVALPDRTYALRGLGDRDATVFKSIVRLLGGKTRDRWLFVDGAQADLLVVSGSTPVQQPSRRSDTPQPRMQVVRVESAGRVARPDALVLPLRAEEVCTVLDRAGERLAAYPSRTVPITSRLQLTRWPSAQLLGADPLFLRLATILGTRPTTMDELAALSECTLAICESFAVTMHVNGMGRWLVEPLTAQPPASSTAPGAGRDGVPAGLFSRIRSRLSL